MKILVSGRDGQVARALAERATDQDLVFVSRPEFDLGDNASIERAILGVRPDVIVSAAAYTAVDQAEVEPERAMRINGEAPGLIGRTAAEVDAHVIHISTDYVFDGSGDFPWKESDRTNPINVYGTSKLAGEISLASSGAEHTVLRTAWVYSPFGKNFVKTMLSLAKRNDNLNVVDDQFGNPTSAFEIADAILAVAQHSVRSAASGKVYHFAGETAMSWAEFAKAVFERSATRYVGETEVTGIPSSEFKTRARRPQNSRLDSQAFLSDFGFVRQSFDHNLGFVIQELLRNRIAG